MLSIFDPQVDEFLYQWGIQVDPTWVNIVMVNLVNIKSIKGINNLLIANTLSANSLKWRTIFLYGAIEWIWTDVGSIE